MRTLIKGSHLSQHLVPRSYITSYGMAIHPYSEGSIHIKSSNSRAYPVIDPRDLSNPSDVKVLHIMDLYLQKLAAVSRLSFSLTNGETASEPGYAP